jgi:hypothetical protein
MVRYNETGFRFSSGAVIFFSSPQRPDLQWGPPSLLSNGYRGLFPPRVKRPGRKTDYPPPSSAEVKNAWSYASTHTIGGCIQKFPDWPPGARIANGTALCHYVQLYRYFVSQSSEFCCHNPLCCFSTCVYCCCLFRCRLSPGTFGYTFV